MKEALIRPYLSYDGQRAHANSGEVLICSLITPSYVRTQHLKGPLFTLPFSFILNIDMSHFILFDLFEIKCVSLKSNMYILNNIQLETGPLCYTARVTPIWARPILIY